MDDYLIQDILSQASATQSKKSIIYKRSIAKKR